jgi:hypothetical protein
MPAEIFMITFSISILGTIKFRHLKCYSLPWEGINTCLRSLIYSKRVFLNVRFLIEETFLKILSAKAAFFNSRGLKLACKDRSKVSLKNLECLLLLESSNQAKHLNEEECFFKCPYVMCLNCFCFSFVIFYPYF